MLSAAGAYLAAGILVYIIGHIVLEIVLRSLVDTSTFMLDEMVGYAVGIMTSLAAGHALRWGALIRVNLLLKALSPYGRARRALEFLAAATTLAVCAFIAVHFWASVSRHFARGTVSSTVAQTPQWIPEGLFLAGLLILCVQLLAYAASIVSGTYTLYDDVPETERIGPGNEP